MTDDDDIADFADKKFLEPLEKIGDVLDRVDGVDHKIGAAFQALVDVIFEAAQNPNQSELVRGELTRVLTDLAEVDAQADEAAAR